MLFKTFKQYNKKISFPDIIEENIFIGVLRRSFAIQGCNNRVGSNPPSHSLRTVVTQGSLWAVILTLNGIPQLSVGDVLETYFPGHF